MNNKKLKPRRKHSGHTDVRATSFYGDVQEEARKICKTASLVDRSIYSYQQQQDLSQIILDEKPMRKKLNIFVMDRDSAHL